MSLPRGIETDRGLQCAHLEFHRARAKLGFGQARQACQIAVKHDDSDAGVRFGNTNTQSPPAGIACSITVNVSVVMGRLSRCRSSVQR